MEQLGQSTSFIVFTYSSGFLGCMAGGLLVASPVAKMVKRTRLILISLLVITLADLLIGPSEMLGLPNDVRLIPVGIFLCNMALI